MSKALAIVPKPPVIEFRRCTEHCCDPVKMGEDPGYFRRRKVIEGGGGDVGWIAENLVWIGWRPPSRGGWDEVGTHEYRCPHFDKAHRKCLIYGHGKRSLMCRTHPNYGRGPWEVCSHEGCTRRTMVVGGSKHIRWCFPDLWKQDRARWYLFDPRPCEATAAPECQDEGYEE